MEKVAAAVTKLQMVFIDISAGNFTNFTIVISDSDLTTIRDLEKVVVMAVDEADTSFGLFQMLIQPVTAIAIAVKVVFEVIFFKKIY